MVTRGGAGFGPGRPARVWGQREPVRQPDEAGRAAQGRSRAGVHAVALPRAAEHARAAGQPRRRGARHERERVERVRRRGQRHGSARVEHGAAAGQRQGLVRRRRAVRRDA
eukprot:4376161-Prymnesium_polylepis.1